MIAIPGTARERWLLILEAMWKRGVIFSVRK
jgi:hypothetical protein